VQGGKDAPVGASGGESGWQEWWKDPEVVFGMNEERAVEGMGNFLTMAGHLVLVVVDKGFSLDSRGDTRRKQGGLPCRVQGLNTGGARITGGFIISGTDSGSCRPLS